MDVTASKFIIDSIQKEDRARWGHSATSEIRKTCLRTAGERSVEQSPRTHITPRALEHTPRSAAVRFLEEKTGSSDPDRPCTRELLYRGVSHDGNGRVEYLKTRRKYGVQERYGVPLTATHSYGLEQQNMSHVASPNCRKPIIQRSFFRTQGVDTYKDLPAM